MKYNTAKTSTASSLYETPAVTVLSVYPEGIMCQSGLILPGSDWHTEEELTNL